MGKFTTVQEMVDGVRRWWQDYEQNVSKDDLDSAKTFLELCCGWEAIRYLGHPAPVFIPKVAL